MENIKYILEVRLIEDSVHGFPKNSTRTILYPFKDVEILVNEVQVCPFCGKPVRALNCNCKDFRENFVKMQKFYGDSEHKSKLHSGDVNLTVAFSKPISDFQFRTLDKKEISDLGADFWDFIDTQVDSLSSGYYKVSPVIHEGGEYFFVCKDLISKSVYRFEVPTFGYKSKEIYLGIYARKTVANLGSREMGKIGNYHFEYYWKNLISFKNWNDLCTSIKSFQALS